MTFRLPAPPPRYDGLDLETWARRMDDHTRELDKTFRELDRVARDAVTELPATGTVTKVSFTVTNHTEDLTLDADASSAAINADVLGSLIKTLIDMKIVGGSVST